MTGSVDSFERQSLRDRFPLRATSWELARRELVFSRMPLLMGIVNVTPDSFSDGGKFVETNAAIEQALRLVEEGADLIDIGGESTRPYADPVSEKEELLRVIPVIQHLCEKIQIPVSIDTSKAAVAREAVAAGAEIINDVTGLDGDPAMIRVAAETSAGVCAMHMQGNPQTMQDDPTYANIVAEINHYLADRLQKLQQAGVASGRICLDPGIGFGKTHQHNFTLLAQIGQFHGLGRPLLVGHSRKGFLAKVLGSKDRDRTAVTVGVSLALAAMGTQIVRVHDVLPVREALLGFVAAGGVDGNELRL